VNPAFSVVFFTTLAGSAQGLVVALALAALAGVAVAPGFRAAMLAVAATMLVIGLGCSFLHLGRPERAWRAAAMWRTSWLSREVIVLPAFIAVVALWWAALEVGAAPFWSRFALPLAAIVLAALLWLCTAMIYACLRFIEEWAHPLTLAGFVLVGLSSGLLLLTATAGVAGESELARCFGPAAVVATILAGGARLLALRRNARIRHRSTLQSATGIAASRLVQTSMGMSAGSFNTREFFHRAGAVVNDFQKLRPPSFGHACEAAKDFVVDELPEFFGRNATGLVRIEDFQKITKPFPLHFFTKLFEGLQGRAVLLQFVDKCD
jgi:DMSO reductase anchor subunit